MSVFSSFGGIAILPILLIVVVIFIIGAIVAIVLGVSKSKKNKQIQQMQNPNNYNMNNQNFANNFANNNVSENSYINENVEKKPLPEVLKEYRVKCGMSQETVAEALEVSRQAVSKWENGLAEPKKENIIALANLYNVTPDEIYQKVAW